METRSRRQQLVIQFSCVNCGFVKGLLDRSGLNGSRLNRSGGN
jgi:hypothetical protein